MSNPIGWCTDTWNPCTGCTPVSEACEHCYAERMARRFLTSACEPQTVDCLRPWFKPRFHPDRLDVPLHWRKPRRVFVCSMSDLFHEAFTDEQIVRVLNVPLHCPNHMFLILTKRPERMRDLLARARCYPDRPKTNERGDIIVYVGLPDEPVPLAEAAPNLWLGVTAENQARADERIPILLDTPAAHRFVSIEPMLGAVDLENVVPHGLYQRHPNDPPCFYDALRGHVKGPDDVGLPHLDFVILGGENGPGARPMQPEWALDVWRQCKAAGVPFWFKQVGSAWDGGNFTCHGEGYEMVMTKEQP